MMMKKKWLSLIAFASFFSWEATSQTVQWAVRPTSAQIEGYGKLLKVRKSGKCGLIDRANRAILPAKYDSITPFRDGYALVMNFKGKSLKIEGILSEGDYEMQPLTEEVYATRYMWFSDGKMPVRGAEGWGYLGTDGNMVIPCQFQTAFPFSCGFASVMLDDKAYYIDRNMDYLPVEVGYGNLVFASTFSGDEAVVYSGNSYTPKGYVINKRGRIVRSYKVKPADLEINKSDHTVGDKALQMEEQVKQLDQDTRYTVYEKNRLYGYKRNGVIVLPAQLEKAEPVRGNYANVRFKGQNGVLRMVDGNYSIQVGNNQIEISGSKVNKGALTLQIPASIEDASVQLRMTNGEGKEMILQPNTSQGRTRTYSFCPMNIPAKSESGVYKVEVWNDNLLLLEKDVNVSCVVKESPKAEAKEVAEERQQPKLRIASMSLSKPPRAKGKKANPKNVFFVTVTVSNDGDERGNATVSLLVDGKPAGNKSVSVRARGAADAVFSVPDIRKERYAKVKATLREGKVKSQEANIHFMPFN